MAKRKTNKPHVEYIFVPTGNQAMKKTGVLNTSGSSYNIARGQLGLISMDKNSSVRTPGTYLQAGDTAADVAAVQLVMGTSYSSNFATSDPWGIKPALLRSPIIKGDKVRSFSGRLAKVGLRSAIYFDGLGTAKDLTTYKGWVEVRSRRNDRDYGNAVMTIPMTFDTPDYTNTATLTQPTAHLVQNMLAKLNEQSKALSTSPSWMAKGNYPVIGFAIDVSGGSGTALGAIDCGTSINVMTTVRNGVSYTASYVADADFVATIQEWIANTNLTAASTIEVINTTTAGTAATPAVDAMVIMGLDQDLSIATDTIAETKTKVEVELGDGFTTGTTPSGADKVIASRAFEGYGDGRVWRIRYQDRAFAQRYNLEVTGHKDNFIDIPLENLDETKTYSVYTIDIWEEEDTLTHTGLAQKRIVILLESQCDCVSAEDMAKVFDSSTSSDGDTVEIDGITFEDDSTSNGVTGGNISHDGTAADFAAKVEAQFPGLRATVSGTEVSLSRCDITQATTSADLDAILEVWLKSTNLSSVELDDALGANYFTPA
jgi:hypothetical protein